MIKIKELNFKNFIKILGYKKHNISNQIYFKKNSNITLKINKFYNYKKFFKNNNIKYNKKYKN